jgi:leucyl aminopeptidase
MIIETTGKKAAETAADMHIQLVFDDPSASVKNSENSQEFKKKNLQPAGSRMVLFLGAGKKKDFIPERARELSGMAVKEAISVNAATITFDAEDFHGHTGAACEGAVLASYTFDGFKSKKEKQGLKKIVFAGASAADKRLIDEARVVSANVMLARDLANSPANFATPSFLEKTARKAALENKKIKVKVFEKEDIKKMGMGAFYAVTQGTSEPAKLIIMEYNGGKKGHRPFVFIGKGITFDSGGISLKPQATSMGGIEDMKFDMSGAAAILALVRTAAELELKVNIIGLIPATENLPDGKAYKPSDVLTTLSGKTVEVISTDAEGRLILCDTITYAVRTYKPEVIVDIATLTGACSATFGPFCAGVMGNDDEVMESLRASGEATGERLWPLPLWDEYMDSIKSKTADIKNTGGGRAGAITAGLFLKEFVEGARWAHLDIAGTAYNVPGKSYVTDGASGFGVRLLLEFLRRSKHF